MKEQIRDRIYESLIVLYVLFILWFCVLSRTETVYEVRPLGWSFQYMWNCWWMGYLFLQTIGNVLLYMPLGFLATRRFGTDKILRVSFTGIVVCIVIEAIQFITSCGTLDFDDMANNLVDVGLGYLCYRMEKTRKISVLAVSVVIAYIILGFRVVWLNSYR